MERIADLLLEADIEKVKTRLEELEEIALACGWIYDPDIEIEVVWSV